MVAKLISQEIQLLPEVAQLEVFNFLRYLKSKYNDKTVESTPKRPSFGCGAIKVTLSKDFNEPLTDFKEYML